MNVQWRRRSSPVPMMIRPAAAGPAPAPGRVVVGLGHKKRLDSGDELPPVAKCARLSAVVESPVDQGLFSTSPGSPPVTSPVPSSTHQHQGPSRIGPFLLLPLDREPGAHSALNTDTGDELVCKVFDMGVYQEKMRAYGVLPPHGNVARIRDIVLGERKAYVFRDKDCGDLHTLVKGHRRLGEERARGLFRQVVAAVAHCHRAGVVLGDLKLRKFVFADEKRTQVKLESLDDCRVLEDPRDDAMSDTHGCPAYVSPEILSGSAPYSGKMADAWSLGVMLYTMLVGRYPFHDADPAALFSKIRRGQCCLPEALSPAAKCLVRGLLRKEPCERLTAAEALAHPWFHRPLPPPPPAQQQEAGAPGGGGEQEVRSAEQTVPSFDAAGEDDDDLFC